MNNDFSSIEKLVEFGLGLGVANQMINTMNNAMSNMKVAGAQSPMQNTQTAYFVVMDKNQAGPFSEHELIELVKAGKVVADTLVWRPGMTSWKLSAELPEVNRLLMLYSK